MSNYVMSNINGNFHNVCPLRKITNKNRKICIIKSNLQKIYDNKRKFTRFIFIVLSKDMPSKIRIKNDYTILKFNIGNWIRHAKAQRIIQLIKSLKY